MLGDSPGARRLGGGGFSPRSRHKRITMDPLSTPGSGTSMPRSRYFKMWSEQISSSGKRYYYNRESEVSQWEKPSEWKEYERSLGAQQRLQSVSKGPPLTPSSTQGAHGVVDTQSPSMTSSPLVVAASKVRVDHQKLAPSSSSQSSYGDQRGTKRPNVDSLALSAVTGGCHPSSNHMQSGYPVNKYRRESSSIQSITDQSQLASAVNSRANDGTSLGKFCSTSTAPQASRTPYVGSSTPFYTPISGYNQQSQSTPKPPQMPGALGDDTQTKYLRFYRPDTTSFRRGWLADHYSVEAKKLAERRRVQDAAIAAIDEDIISVQSLLETAESKSAILAKKLQMMGQRIAALEGKSL